ncbi:hypothetical protein Dimus_017473 [Dionaea muscipula]
MANDSPSSSPQPPHFSNGALSANPPASSQRPDPEAIGPLLFGNDPSNLHSNGRKFNSKGKRRVSSDSTANPSRPSSCSSSLASSSTVCPPQSSIREMSVRINTRRRNPRFLVRRRVTDVEAIAFPLGMSIAAVVAQVLEQQEATSKNISADHLSRICTSAVRESLANVFGDKFEAFAAIFEKSFGSTLSTLRLIKDSTAEKGNHQVHSSCEPSSSASDKEELSLKTMHIDDSASESEAFTSLEQLTNSEVFQEGQQADTMTHDLFFNRQFSQQLISSSSNVPNGFSNASIFNTWNKSVVEQTRANDLKAFEIALIMKNLQLKESRLALNSESNFLERCKILLGISKASFNENKFKNNLEETRHAELLRKCIDCLVAGLLIMSASLAYGTYIHSYKRIIEATSSCSDSMESKSSWASWFAPKAMTSFNSGMQTLRCQVQVFSRMLFGLLIILAVAYLLIQRATITKQMMPVTFIVLLLGTGCGFAGKLCLDTLGGSGYHWLMYWEILCAVHFFANICTPFLFGILHGPITVSPGVTGSAIFPYWLRRVFFYLSVLLFLPLLCGLIPFASLGEWKDHFWSKAEMLQISLMNDAFRIF